MHIQQISWRPESGWSAAKADFPPEAPQAVLYFASKSACAKIDCYEELKRKYPQAMILGCSTGGEIFGAEVSDDGVVATAIAFAQSTARLEKVEIAGAPGSHAAGQALGRALKATDLRCVFVLSDGTRVNGSELVAGMTEIIGRSIPITGGLAGDGDRFRSTLVGADCTPREGLVAALGLYGDALRVGHGSMGGWDVFGPQRMVTRSKDNILFALDDAPALDLYKKYLGEHARELPGSALLFPLTIWAPDQAEQALVRTIVGIDEQAKSMIFAGNVPEGYVAQLMHGNFDHLIEGAASAARMATVAANGSDTLALLVSCIGRKLLLGQRIGDEVEAVRDALGDRTYCTGFYSYGEISPYGKGGTCELHNQTMTVTTLAEA